MFAYNPMFYNYLFCNRRCKIRLCAANECYNQACLREFHAVSFSPIDSTAHVLQVCIFQVLHVSNVLHGPCFTNSCLFCQSTLHTINPHCTQSIHIAHNQSTLHTINHPHTPRSTSLCFTNFCFTNSIYKLHVLRVHILQVHIRHNQSFTQSFYKSCFTNSCFTSSICFTNSCSTSPCFTNSYPIQFIFCKSTFYTIDLLHSPLFTSLFHKLLFYKLHMFHKLMFYESMFHKLISYTIHILQVHILHNQSFTQSTFYKFVSQTLVLQTPYVSQTRVLRVHVSQTHILHNPYSASPLSTQSFTQFIFSSPCFTNFWFTNSIYFTNFCSAQSICRKSAFYPIFYTVHVLQVYVSQTYVLNSPYSASPQSTQSIFYTVHFLQVHFSQTLVLPFPYMFNANFSQLIFNCFDNGYLLFLENTICSRRQFIFSACVLCRYCFVQRTNALIICKLDCVNVTCIVFDYLYIMVVL